MNVLSVSILAVLVSVVLFAPRRWAILSIISGVLYLHQSQFIEILGFKLFGLRFIEVAGFSRVVIRREFSLSRLNEIDRTLLLLYGYTTVVFLFRSTEGHAYQIGLAVDAILSYFIFRGLIGDIEDFRWFLKAFLFLLAPFTALVLLGDLIGHNPFVSTGGVAEFFSFRDGRARSMANFRHPVLMGTLGASFLPLYIGLYLSRVNRGYALLGISLCLGIVWLSNSGGPLSSVFVGLVGWLLWVKRIEMTRVRYGLMGFVLLFLLVMKAPIWYLPAKISSVIGGDGWHRSYLMDIAFKNLDKWWFAGMPIRETISWFPYTLSVHGGADITNHYLKFGISAGIVSIGLFILLIIKTFSRLGRVMRQLRSRPAGSRSAELLMWGLGVTLLVHTVNWIGVSYFDQINIVWFMQLAFISVMTKEDPLFRPLYSSDEAGSCLENRGQFTC